jgi:hypothetical protein
MKNYETFRINISYLQTQLYEQCTTPEKTELKTEFLQINIKQENDGELNETDHELLRDSLEDFHDQAEVFHETESKRRSLREPLSKQRLVCHDCGRKVK